MVSFILLKANVLEVVGRNIKLLHRSSEKIRTTFKFKAKKET